MAQRLRALIVDQQQLVVIATKGAVANIGGKQGDPFALALRGAVALEIFAFGGKSDAVGATTFCVGASSD